jgi:hypothetical protein
MTNAFLHTVARLLDDAGAVIKKDDKLNRKMTNALLQTAARLLEDAGDIVKKYDARYRKTGLKYNIFKAARISEDERVMCRVIADLLNPKGSHCRGGVYLELFWKMIRPKLEDGPPLDYETARVSTEYATDEGRRIDIAIEDGKTFIPIEVKIWAGDQEKQVADYAKFARKKNGNDRIRVLYLTWNGHEPADAEKEDYICLSFAQDIIAWLTLCLNRNETQAAPPVREIIRELVEAIKSFCGKPEDEEMEKELLKLVCKSEDTVRAALAISGAVTGNAEFQGELAYNEFYGPILELVKKSFPEARRDAGKDYDGIYVPIQEGNYWLFVNYDWYRVEIDFNQPDYKSNPKLEAAIAKKMSEITGLENNGGEDVVWFRDDSIKYPTLSSVADDLYYYRLYMLYKKNPREVADRIISMARALKEV